MPVPPQDSEIIIEHHNNISETQQSTKSSSIRARLAGRISVTAEHREASRAVIKAKDARSYQLPNSASWFRKAKASTEICRWLLEEAGGNIFFVVGYRTLVDTHLRETRSFGSCTVQEGDLGESPTQSSDAQEPIGVGDVEEIQVDAHTRSLYASEETIYAVQYRKVTWGWKSRNIENAVLEPTSRWEIMWGHMR